MSSVWRGNRAACARFLVVVARDAGDAYDHCLDDQPVVRVQLNAAPDELAERVARRAAGERPRLAGDSLLAALPWVRREIADRAAAEARALRHQATSRHIVIDTGRHDIATVTGRLLGLLEPSLHTS